MELWYDIEVSMVGKDSFRTKSQASYFHLVRDLCPFWYFDLFISSRVWYRDLMSQHKIKYSHCSIDVKIIVFTAIDCTCFDSDLYIEVSSRSSSRTSISFASMSYIDTIFDRCWDIDSEFFFGDFQSSRYSFTVFGIEFSWSLTGWTNILCLHYPEDRLWLLCDASFSFTGRTFFFSSSWYFCLTRKLYRLRDTIIWFFKRYIQTHLDVFTWLWSSWLTTSSSSKKLIHNIT